jgi:predicted acyl esterase
VIVAIVALVASLFPATEPALATPTHYVEMSDGVSIAVNIRMPNGFRKGKRYPTIFEMSGYDGDSADGGDPTGDEGSRALTKQFYDDYVTVHASVRGTGCSGGRRRRSG